MKITKERLIEIIKEEVKAIKEMGAYNRDGMDDDPIRAMGFPDYQETPAAGMPASAALQDHVSQIEDAVFKAIEMIDEHGSDPDLTDVYVAFLRAIERGGVNLKRLLMIV